MNDRTPASPTIRLTLWSLIVAFAAAVVFSSIARIEIVARGSGKAIPTNRVQLVQPQTDGKIVDILVREGQFVRRGDQIVTMEDTATRSEITRIRADIQQQTQESIVARSILEPLAGGDPTAPNFLEAAEAVLQHQGETDDREASNTHALVLAVLSGLRDQIAQIDADLDRIARTQDAYIARVEKARLEREIVSRRFAAVETLRKHGAISEFDYLERLSALKAAEQETVITERELQVLSAEAQTVSRRRSSALSEVRLTYQKQLNQSNVTLKRLSAELTAAERRLADASLEAPVSGRVENLSVFTIGGFVEAGASLMTIVPSDGGVELEAFFDNRDIGFLREGQRAFVKFDAFPAERFGIVRGIVSSVGADARQQSASRWVYAVRLKLDQNSIQIGAQRAAFAPGMTATIDIVTGERRLITYFFEPILKAIQDSFGER